MLGATYGIICPACTKPNSLSTDFCTGCSFPVSKYDIYRLPDNIFLELVKGKDIGANVRYRDSNYIIFDDKFPVSDNHIDIIPCDVYTDISVLNKQHIPLLQRLYELGKEELLKRNIINGLINANNIDSYISAGYNYPVSVKHLHLHMMVPPYKHEKILQYPRWHSHTKVINDLNAKGKVQLYSEVPDLIEGPKEQARAIENDKRIKQSMENQQHQQQQQ
jgi:diadenosine tetraphosphate (Ap4A) HIT family hydrolase